MGTYGSIDFDDEEIEAASHWYGGQGSMLYAITSTGALSRGTIRPRHDDGTPMTDEEWIVDLAERLESEADAAADDAAKRAKKAKGDERKELKADQKGLRSIAFKARQYIRDAERAKKQHGEKWLTTRHLSSHATKKSPAQLDREIAEALAGRSGRSSAAAAAHATKSTGTGKRIERKKLGEMMSPWGGDFAYGEGTGAIGAVSSYYYSDMKYPERRWVERALTAIETDIPKAEHGAHGWTKKDAADLRRIAQGLRYYLHHDYEGGSAHATKRPSTASYGDRPGAWQQGYDFGKESALHETRAEQREVLRRVSPGASAYDEGLIAAYQDALGIARTRRR